MKKKKSFFDKDNLNACLNWCKISGKVYRVIVSNYTVSIEGAINIKFVRSNKSMKCFAAYRKIKSDVEKSNIVVDINKNEVNYFNSELYEFERDEIFNIDLKSAYATILKNDKIIKGNTFNYLTRLEKKDRLASVGMLASHKYVFDYLGNDILKFSEIKSDTEEYFYYCVKRTYDIMTELKKICGTSYLFCWVDSVYYTDKSKTPLLIDYLKSINFRYSFEILNNVKSVEAKSHYKVTFGKGDKVKYFCVPKNEGSFSRDIITKHLKHLR